jgi:hypothetical protein
MSYEFQSAEEIEGALQGEYGAELQQQAEGLVAQVRADETVAAQGQVQALFSDEAVRLEKHLGRNLTRGEINRLYAEVPETGQVGDLVANYAEGLAHRGSDSRSRQELSAEFADDVFKTAEEEAPQELPSWETPS